MYQMSQYNAGQSFSQCSGLESHQSRLEQIAYSRVEMPTEGSIAYAITAPSTPFSQKSYAFSVSSSNGGYSPVISSLLSPTKSYLLDGAVNYTLNQKEGGQGNYLSTPSHKEYHFQPEQFLKPGKEGKFVGQAEEIREFVEESFEKMFDTTFPEDIKISVCTEEQFRKLAPHPGTIGLSINRRKQGLLSEIFVLNGSLGRVLLTVGHELGHVFTHTLEHAQNEEAKAYAFSMAWMEVIKEHNIAGLQSAFVDESPAHNGLHDVAFGFVSQLLKEGQ